MANNKIIANGETLIDLTADTVTAGTLVSGTTAHDRSGASITGTFDPSVYVLKVGDTMSGPLNFGTTGKISETELKINGRDLLTEFKTHTSWSATLIPNNSDLNTTTFLKPGRYYIGSSNNAATLANTPTTNAFYMDVDLPISVLDQPAPTYAYIHRTITTYNGAVFFQYVNSGATANVYTYGSWVCVRYNGAQGNTLTQVRTNDSNEYQLLFSEIVGRDVNNQTARARKCEGLYYNPASAAVYIRRMHDATATASSSLLLGNSVANGSQGASYGVLWLYGKGDKWARFEDTNNILTANRIYTLPNKDGELAILGSDSLNVGNRIIEVTGADEARSIRIGTKAGGYVYLTYFANGGHGLYSSGYESDIADTSTFTSSNKWIIRRNSGGNVFVDEWASIGSASKPVYFSSSGRPVAGNETTTTSKAAASGGTDLSLVTTGEKYTWNSKTSNTGTVTSVAVSGSKGISISGSPITTSGTVTVSVDTTSGTATRNTTNTSSGTLTYVRYGKVVYIYGDFSLSTSSTDKTVFTGLPAPEKANCYITSLGPTATDGGSVFKINSSGQLLTALRTAKTGNNYISATYIADY